MIFFYIAVCILFFLVGGATAFDTSEGPISTTQMWMGFIVMILSFLALVIPASIKWIRGDYDD